MATTTPDGIRQLLDSTSDPAYSVDENGRLSGWNDPAERLFGYSREEVVGRFCHEVLRGRDVFGNPYCEEGCPLLLMARQSRSMRHFQMDARLREGRGLRVLCFVLVVPGEPAGTFSIVHQLRPVERPLSPWPTREEGDPPRLTERELEVLRLLAGGSTTGRMAETLNISPSTARKHVQNIFRKLKVGNRLAAVLAAFELQIL